MLLKQKLFYLLIILFISNYVLSQTAGSSTLGFTAYPTTVSSLGMGNSSVALTNADDAMTFNPANIVFNKGISLSYFNNPYYSSTYKYPFTNLNLSFTIPSIGAFSIEYRNQSFGDVQTTTAANPDGSGETSEYYKRSYTIGYARYLNEEISVGASIRYAGEYQGQVEGTGFLFSLGTNYNPKFLEKRLSVGFSIMNLGSSIEYEHNVAAQQNDVYSTFNFPPPSFINLGANFEFAKNSYYTSSFQLAFSKPIMETDDNGSGKSSFKSLFSDWDDFPRDVNLHTGIAFEWEPISLGNDFTFLQEMYFGNNSFGIANANFNAFTHGVNMGIGYENIEFKFGYTGTWHFGHLNYIEYYQICLYPRESWQFSVNWEAPEFLGFKNNETHSNLMEKINLLVGTGYSLKVGNFSDPNFYSTNENNLSYYLEADFYFNKRTALISNFTYSPYNHVVDYNGYKSESKIENISLSSSLRHHPIESFSPFFIQTGLGIYRTNPVAYSYPKYSYKTFFTNKIGGNFNISDDLILQPEIGWILLLDRTGGDTPRLKGQNQFDFSLKFGYSL